MGPDHKNVVDEAQRGVWLVRRMCKCTCLEFSEEYVSVGRSHACSHGCAVCLNIEGVDEFKNVHSKDDPDEVTEMTGRKNCVLQVPLVVPYKAIGKFPKALYAQRGVLAVHDFFRRIIVTVSVRMVELYWSRIY